MTPRSPDAAAMAGPLADLLDAVPDAMIAFDAGLCVTAWNAATAQGTGIARAQALGRSVLELFPYIRGTAVEQEYRRALAGETVDGRDRCWTPTGTEQPRWFDVTYSPVRDATGAVVGGIVLTRDVTARRESAEAPPGERRLLRTLIDSAPHGMLAFDREWCIVEWNAWAERSTGRRRDDVVGRPLFEVLPELVGTEVQRDYERALAGETVQVRDRWYATPDGEPRCYDAVFAPMHDGRGMVTGGVMMAIDMTERVRAQRALEESEARYRQLFDRSAAAQLVVDTDARAVTAANDAALALFGYGRDTLVGMPVATLCADGNDTLSSGRQPCRTASGERVVVEAYAAPVTRDGRPLVHATLVDVTARVRAEAERDRLIRIVEATTDLVATANPVTRTLTYINRAGRDLLGLSAEEPLPTIEQVVAAADHPLAFDVALPTVLRDGVWRGEVRLTTRDGRSVPTSVVVVAHADADGDPDFVSAIVRDVSTEKAREAELQSAREAAERASTAKSAFLAGLSHELRTPLGAVLGFAQLLRDGVDDPLSERQREYLDDVLTGATHLHAVVDDALDLARIEAGAINLRPRLVDLRRVVAEAVAAVRALADDRDVRLEHVVASDASHIVADTARVRQVLLNYLTNAIKFNVAGGRVRIEVASSGDAMVRLTVRDTGRGIASEDVPRLFVEFQRLGPRDVPGTGLGLAITRRIVEAMGGTVAAESEPGVGSVFHASLPRGPAAPPPPSGDVPQRSASLEPVHGP